MQYLTAPLLVVSLHFQYTTLLYAGFIFRKPHRRLTGRKMHLPVYNSSTVSFSQDSYTFTMRFRPMQDSPKSDLRKPHRRLTRDSHVVRCMFSYSTTVRLNVAPLLVVFILIYYTIPAYAGFGEKVTFENCTGDSQAQRAYEFEFSTALCKSTVSL